MATKFHRWAKTCRLPRVGSGECILCDEVGPCFAFLADGGYGMERLCRDCLLEALRLLEGES